MSWTALADRDRKARKSYRCVWCGEEIASGSAYHQSTGKFEGCFQSNRYHEECWKAADFTDLQEGFTAGAFKRGTMEER